MSNSIEPKKGHAGLRPAAMTVVASSSMAKLGAEARFKRNPKEVIQDLQKKHAFAMSDMEQGTTIGLILTGTRVKAVIPRPLVHARWLAGSLSRRTRSSPSTTSRSALTMKLWSTCVAVT